LRDYELVMVLSPQVDEEAAAGIVEKFSKFIADRGGAISNQEIWGIRRLAYPIQNFREGNYMLTQFSFEPGSTSELENSLKTSEEIIRYLLVKREQ
jgi:small subunit ribosomal protein S6